MSDDTPARNPDRKDDQPGKFHYNPGNMAGEKAGIVDEIEKQERISGNDDDRRGRKPDADPNDKQSDLDVPGGKGLVREEAGETPSR